MKKPVELVAGEGLTKAIGLIRRAGIKGVTVIQLAQWMNVGQSTANNYLRRLTEVKLITCRHGSPEEIEITAGRPPNIYTWAGRSVKLVTLEAFWESQKSEERKAKEARRARAGKSVKKPDEDATFESSPDDSILQDADGDPWVDTNMNNAEVETAFEKIDKEIGTPL